MTDQAFVTLTMSDVCVRDALVLDLSFKQHRTARRMGLLTTRQVSDCRRRVAVAVFDGVVMVAVLDTGDSVHLTL